MAYLNALLPSLLPVCQIGRKKRRGINGCVHAIPYYRNVNTIGDSMVLHGHIEIIFINNKMIIILQVESSKNNNKSKEACQQSHREIACTLSEITLVGGTLRMHSNLASFKKPTIQFSQCQDAQTPNKPVSKQPTFIMPTFKTTQRQIAQF
jgi:hypothetical protein